MMPEQFLPLHAAAATAYTALADKAAKDRLEFLEGVLDVVAIALAACTPIYGARGPQDALARLSDADLAGGKFAHGAASLRFADGRLPFTRLALTRADFAEGVARLKRAGVNFSHARFEPAPRRVPRVRPA
jgi:hypothetical protein